MAGKMLQGIAAAAMAVVLAVTPVVGLAEHDTITWGGDNSRTGYFPNNNMDPAVVTSSEFNQIFRVKLPGDYMGDSEKIFSQPLTYTPKGGDGTQFVYWATAQNNVYKMNAKTGQILASTNLGLPFLSVDLPREGQEDEGYCQDINPVIGIIGTGVIDPDSETLYLTAKTYVDQTKPGVAQGRPAGRIFIHALSVHDLSERPNFPIDLEGRGPRNNPTRLFNGGIQNQRPGLLHPLGSDYIYAGFGSHCVHYNFTGWLVGWHKTTGEVVELWATQGEGVPSQPGASLWMSGGGIASDDKGSIFYATGNGYSQQVKDLPINRGTIPTSLEEAVVHQTYGDDGRTGLVDFFMPENKAVLDGNDQDLGTSPLQILPSDPFSCGEIKRIGVITGKDKNTFFLNLDDLGGYRTGPNRQNRVIGQYFQRNAVYAGAGVSPLDGGYVYINVIGFETTVFKFNCVNGVPAFTKVADTPLGGQNGFGVGHGATTSLKGQPGTGLFWIADTNNAVAEGHHLRIYETVPTGNGGTILRLLKSFNTPGINKFSRPQFGDGTMYIGTNQGFVYGYGAPTNPALNCTTASTDFGVINVGTDGETKTITCTAKIGLTIADLTLESTDFTVADVPTLPRTVAAQGTFVFQANFKPSRVGSRSASISIKTTNNVAGYSSTTSVRLVGEGESADALLTIEPSTVTFNQAVLGSSLISNSVLLSNDGLSSLSVESIQYSTTGPSGSFVPATNTGNGTSVGHFSFHNLPTSLAAETQQLVSITFNPSEIGTYRLWAVIESNGGQGVIAMSASVGATPQALIQLEKPDGSGWQSWTPGEPALSFGEVTQNTALRLRFRISNIAPNGSVELQVPISKPPFGVPGLINTVNQVDIGEGTAIKAGEHAEAFITCTAPKTQWNTDSYTRSTTWTFNTNDITLGKFEVPFTCTAVAQQGGPVREDGSGTYRYVGCYRENNPGRQLQTQLYGNNNLTADMCLTSCAERGFAYCGTQYHRECWGGPSPPTTKVSDLNCNFACSGDIGQWCGGNGVGDLQGNAHISLWATNATLPPPGTGPNPPVTPNPPVGAPVVNPGLNGYRSIGCYNEISGRALPNSIKTAERTVAACINACAPLGYKYVGLQYGGECWCANEFREGSVPVPIGECNIACNDNKAEYCGGSQRLNVYQTNGTIVSTTRTTPGPSATVSVSLSSTSTAAVPTSTVPAIKQSVGAYRYQGCYVANNQGGRSLQGRSFYDDPMTLEKCAAACSQYTWWGIEYGRECYCDNQLRGNTAPDSTNTTCSFLCPGDKLTYCGAGSRLSMYKFDSLLNSTESSSSSGLTSTPLLPVSTPVVQTSSVADSFVLDTPSGSVSTVSNSISSSFVETSSSELTTPEATPTSDSVSSATSTSESVGSEPTTSAAPTTSADETTIQSTSAVADTTNVETRSEGTTTSEASSTEATTSSEVVTRSEVTTSIVTTTSTPPTTVSTVRPSTTTASLPTISPPLWPGNVNFTYYGCVAGPSAGRLVSRQVVNSVNMTHDMCLEACWMYDYAGVEYGRECWCGNGPINWAGNTGATPGFNTTEKECDINCAGNSTAKCGGRKRLTLFYFDETTSEE
ncbi:WSC domain-containing protein [Paramyrothecium foliicola]|nr:WSC domain-containing protein [Paramyrothecium foliicola]